MGASDESAWVCDRLDIVCPWDIYGCVYERHDVCNMVSLQRNTSFCMISWAQTARIIFYDPSPQKHHPAWHGVPTIDTTNPEQMQQTPAEGTIVSLLSYDSTDRDLQYDVDAISPRSA